MRHKYSKVTFKGGYDRTRAMKRSLVRNFIMSGSVTVTEKRAGYIKQKIDRIVKYARRYTSSDEQSLKKFFGEHKTIEYLRSLDYIMNSKRVSGLVKTTKIGYRVGDSSLKVKVVWTDVSKAKEVKLLSKDKENEKKQA